MEITQTKVGAEINLTANDVESAVMQFICSCHPSFSRGHSITVPGAVALTAQCIKAVRPSVAGVNDIGVAGQLGFGVGICPGPLPEGMGRGIGTHDITSADYGNYAFADGSTMVWVPAFYYKYGTGTNGLLPNIVDVKSIHAFADEAAANSAGYALHRAFVDDGQIQAGFFVDKFLCSNNNGVASSIKNAKPLSTYESHNPISGLTGSPDNAYYGTVAAAKTRGADFFVSSRFIFSALALLSLAHASATADTEYCAWHDPDNNFPKGCNNANLKDNFDSSVVYQGDGYGSCGLTGSATPFAKTTHNGQESGVADLNGLMWEVTPGITSDGEQFFAMAPSVAMKSLTSGDKSASDIWGKKAIATNYQPLGLEESGYSKVGSTSPVFSAATSSADEGYHMTALGIPAAGGTRESGGLFSGAQWHYTNKALCPISGGYWSDGSNAGVWAFDLNNGRGDSNYYVGFRSALYL